MQAMETSMRPGKLMVRCVAEKHDGLWVAYCLDFSLGAQADTFEQARAKLDEQIREYLLDVLTGADRAFAEQLLRRRAPLSYWFKYWAYKWLARITGNGSPRNGAGRSFKEPMPLTPAHC